MHYVKNKTKVLDSVWRATHLSTVETSVSTSYRLLSQSQSSSWSNLLPAGSGFYSSSLPEVSLAAGRHPGRSMPGSPYNISRDDRGLQQVVLNAAYSFNNQSNDAFLFKASAIHRAQRQVRQETPGIMSSPVCGFR